MTIELQTYRDFLQPFLIHHSNVQGKMVRINEVLNTIVSRHQYPDPVSRLLAEMLVVASILSGNLKGEGLLTIQLKGEGMVRFMVVDATADGELRGYAELNDTADFSDGVSPDFEMLVGKGHLAITLDKGNGPYQGIVALKGEQFTDCIQEYFTNSEQQGIWLKIMVDSQVNEEGETQWHAGGVMLQHMPSEGGKADISQQITEDPEELWSRAVTLAHTLKESELFDISLSPQALLYRLYSEDGVWVYESSNITVGCRCSRDKITNALVNFPRDEVESMLVDNEIIVNCQFCNQAEVFSPNDIEELFSNIV